MPPVSNADAGFSPLDHELGLLPNHRFTPRVEGVVARLGQALPFAEAAAIVAQTLGVVVSEATTRRTTYAAGTAAVAVEERALRQVERTLPRAAIPPARRQLSSDATTVPLVGGDWTEVKLAAIADLVPGPAADEPPGLAAVQVSYAARWEPAEQFGRTLTLEATRRGLDEARLVVSPNDGAEWIQSLLDLVAPQAVRILDEPHAAEHLGAIAGLVYGEGTPAATQWVAAQRQRLRTEPPAGVLAELTRCLAQGPRPDAPVSPTGETPAQVLAREVAYFQKRAEQIQYAAFQAAGYPIGSGMVESGHKVVIGQRFKGAGQHWARHHLNPLLVLRTTSCTGRWTEAWPAIWAEHCRMGRARRRTGQACPPTPAPPSRPASTPPLPDPSPAVGTPPRPKLVVNGRPTKGHPWRRFGGFRSQRSLVAAVPKS